MTAPIGIVLILVILIAGPWVCPLDPVAQDREAANAPPSGRHWLGTDDFGRDLAARYLYGGRWSVFAGSAGTAIALTLGWTVGSAAGFMGGAVDTVIMAISEWFLVVPWLYLLLAARAVMPLDLAPRTVMLAIVVLIGVVNWARPARLARGLVLSLSQKGYVEAARGFGVPGWKILTRHIFPGTIGVLIAQSLSLMPRFVLAELTLSFLGLGAGEPQPSWGGLIVPLKQMYLLGSHWWTMLPALLMVPFFACFALVSRDLERRNRPSR